MICVLNALWLRYCR